MSKPTLALAPGFTAFSTALHALTCSEHRHGQACGGRALSLESLAGRQACRALVILLLPQHHIVYGGRRASFLPESSLRRSLPLSLTYMTVLPPSGRPESLRPSAGIHPVGLSNGWAQLGVLPTTALTTNTAHEIDTRREDEHCGPVIVNEEHSDGSEEDHQLGVGTGREGCKKETGERMQPASHRPAGTTLPSPRPMPPLLMSPAHEGTVRPEQEPSTTVLAQPGDLGAFPTLSPRLARMRLRTDDVVRCIEEVPISNDNNGNLVLLDVPIHHGREEDTHSYDHHVRGGAWQAFYFYHLGGVKARGFSQIIVRSRSREAVYYDRYACRSSCSRCWG